MKNPFKYTIAALLLFVLLFSSCVENKVNDANGGNHAHKEAEGHNEGEGVMLSQQQFDALQMKVDTLQLRNMSGYVEVNGQLEVPPQNEASITSVIGANVVSIEVIEGDKVKKGQTVAYLSHPNIIQKQTDYLDAYSNREFLKKEYERQQKLYDAGVGSGSNFQKAEAEYRASRAKVNGLAAQLLQLNINAEGIKNGTFYQRVALRSPIEGSVQKVRIKTGQYVAPKTNLFEVVDTHHVHADLMVFEKDVYKIKEGQMVKFSVQSLKNKELTAEIYSIGKTFEQNPKALHVHAEIENKEGNLIPGMYIKGRIQVENNKVKALPVSAIAKEGAKSFVFAVGNEGDAYRFVPHEVTLGAKDGDWAAVHFLRPLEADVPFAFNNAYYLMAEMKKGEAEHSH
ncbi:membrane fusion protein, cobalt-zinc-cadmium efflux system [Zobellia uliginosa]|uniref:Membrane fusion protein, cobalt-zinc-cadmium efflux system n=1 Tax=Zobellia uliginosa TaxID=143224 RepID=A0ABY1KYM2_9FLAO|nr:efflux RND transporter periplasmic adaptor subunit [Zobellia uliginosa]SIS94239.1 membrane fusion protein, cobalt-zinc-cadmium efflux system [Zobellia uliginosa]